MGGCAAILLAGGQSARMGRSKAELDWFGASFTEHLARLLAETVEGPVVVACAPGQSLPALPAGIEIVEDERPGRGPLEGVAAGLRSIGGRARTAFVSAVDVPFLAPAFVRHVLGALEPGLDAAVPRRGGRAYPLSGAYSVGTLARVEALLARDELRAGALLDELRVRWLDEAELLGAPELASADPGLLSLTNINTPAEYAAAIRACHAGEGPSAR